MVKVFDRYGNLRTGPAVTAHGDLTGLGADDHPQYQLRSEKGVADGYASLDSTAKLPEPQLPVAIDGGNP